jgi:ABC-type antimicrobial peptide transport system permease subunit
MAIFEIVRANIRSKKGNFISIFILLFIIVVALATIISTQSDYKNKIDESCDYSSVADITSFISGKKITNEMKDGIGQMEQVKSYLVRDGIAMNNKNISIDKTSYSSTIIFCKYNPSEHKYRMYDATGESYEKKDFIEPKVGEIYVPIAMKEKLKCQIGDTLNLSYNGWGKTFQIAGFYEEPMVGASMIGVKLFLINGNDYNEMLKDPQKTGCSYYPLMEIYLKDAYRDKADTVKTEINEKTGAVDAAYYTMTRSQSVEYTNIFVTIENTVSKGFVILLFLITLIVIGHNVNSTIEMEYKQLGILKSLGFSSSQIRNSILLEYMIAGVIASVFGFIVSFFVIQALNRLYIPITGILIHANVQLLTTTLFLILLLVVIAGYILFRARRVTAISPVQAISDGMGPVHFGGRADFDITKIKHGSLSFRLTWKQLLGNWKKYMINLVIVALLVSFTMNVSSIQQLTDEENAIKVFGGYLSDVSISYDQDTKQYVDEIRNQIDQKLQIRKESQIFAEYMTIDKDKIIVKVVDKTENMQPLLEGRAPKYDNEVAITKMAGKELGKKIGDSVNIQFHGVTKSFIITGNYQSTSDAGISGSLLQSGFHRIDPDYKALTVDYQVANKQDISSVVKQLSEKYKNYGEKLVITNAAEKQEQSDNTQITAINSMTLLTYVLAIIFAAVISLMMCRKNFMQENRNMGVYKSLGYTSSALRRQFVTKYMIVVTFGVIAGIALNYVINNSLVVLLFSSIGVSEFSTVYNLELLLIPSLFMMITTTFFAWVASARIKRVSPKNLINE